MSTYHKKLCRKMACHTLAGLLLFISLAPAVRAGDEVNISGVVRDSSGAVLVDADVSLLNAQSAIISTTKTDAQGRFSISNVPEGSYVLVVNSQGFTETRTAVNARAESIPEISVTLEPRAASEEVTVTAIIGNVESVESISQQVNVIPERQIEERAKTVLSQAANEEVGVHLQRTSPTIGGIVIRGVTGNKVNVYVDGVRYTTSAQRGGISTFLNLLDPSTLQALEILRGPNSAQYGSDALGGSVQVLSRIPGFAADGDNVNGRLGVFFNSADLSFGSNLTSSFATKNFGLLTNIAGRRVNTLRPGGGIDSHNAVTRFFGVSSDIAIDGRLPDTAFTQYGGLVKMNWAPATGSNFIVSYLRGQQDGGKRYDQLLGGDGTLIGDLRNLMNDFFYVRYDKVDLGWLDGFTATYSFNSQREERVNQGGNGNPRASINHEYERINVNGVSAYANKLIGSRQNLLFGADFYNERMHSPAFGVNPVSEAVTIRRPRVPDNALYKNGGIYVQDVWEAIPNLLRLTGNLRYSRVTYNSKEEDAPIVDGIRLWPDDSLDVSAVTFRAGAVLTPVEGVSLLANVSRGFRAPHMTDLGALGLVGTGFEVSASEVSGLNGTVGSTADDEAVTTGLPIQQLEPETSMNYELGVRVYGKRIDTDLAVFFNEIKNNIVKQSLILPPGAVGQRLGSETITEQLANGVVFVDVATTPVLVRANFGKDQIWGIEHTFDLRINRDWSFGSILTYVHTQAKNGVPAPDGWFRVRYAPAGRNFWIEPYVHAAYRQSRLSSIDLADRRTGARRTAGSIASFFANGATARGLVDRGADGVFGTDDDFLIATGETLEEIQTRVLGPDLEPSSLFTRVPGYATFNVRGGFKLNERNDLLIEFENITDRNYRGVDWGIDGPGAGVYVRFNTRF
ncbi:MAG TPA: TonB-dependent receptor [Blastocatellia bacterium]|nr:TonB-dependent receptor [Blastocatellia bacterium]